MLLSWYGDRQRSLPHHGPTFGTQPHCAVPFFARRLRLSRQAHPDAGGRSFLQHHQTLLANQCSHDHSLEAALPPIRTRWTRYLSSGQPATVLTPALHARILSATRKKPSDGSTHWSCRKLAAALGVSKDAVHRVWKEAGVKPHRLERYMASDDPEFERKAADILGLYLNPPQHAAVFCVDEKTAIQALDRLDPVLPLSPGRAERHGFEYYR